MKLLSNTSCIFIASTNSILDGDNAEDADLSENNVDYVIKCLCALSAHIFILTFARLTSQSYLPMLS